MAAYTREDLVAMQNWSLERKIQVTQTRIMEWYDHYKGQVYVSFSGGKDSTVLLDLARRVYPDIPAVFVDTGLEFPELREFVKTIDNVTWLKPKMRFDEVIKKYGYPVVSKEQAKFIYEYRHTKSEKLRNTRLNGNQYGMGKIAKKWQYLIDTDIKIGAQCCDVLKKNPCKAYEKETGRKPIVGTMTDESKQRESNWLLYGCNAFEKARPTSQPLSFWTEQDILRYLKITGIPYCNVYGDIVESSQQTADSRQQTVPLVCTGEERTGCVFCCFGIQYQKEPNKFQLLKESRPKMYEYCMKPFDEGGLGMDKVLNILNVPH